MSGDRRPVVVDVGVQRFEDELRLLEPFAVDVVQREVGILQRFAAHAVADDVAGEYRAAGSHECDFRHLSFLRILCDVSAGGGPHVPASIGHSYTIADSAKNVNMKNMLLMVILCFFDILKI